MTLFFYQDGVDMGGSAVRLNTMQLSSGADGTVAFGGLLMDDPTGALTVTGWDTFTVTESACTSAPRLFTGYMADRRYRRAPGGRTGAAREIDCNLVDQNAVLGLRILNLKAASRPAETDIDRIDWLLGSNDALNGLVQDLGLVDRAVPRPQEKADYRGQYSYDVLTDICGPSRRLFFVYWDQDAQALGLFYDYPTATTNTSTLTISNVLSDVTLDASGNVTGTCYPPSIDAELTRDPSEVYSRVRFTYAAGTVTRDNATTATGFFGSPINTRGLQVDNSRVGLQTTAIALADQVLARDSGENDTLNVTIQLPAASVGLVDAGMRIGVRFSHLPGYETQVFTRVTRRNISQAQGTDQLYDVALELNTHGLSSTGGGGAPGPGVFPQPTGAPPSLIQSATKLSGGPLLPTPVDPTDGDLLFLWLTERGTLASPAIPSGWTSVATAKNTSVFADNYYARLVSRTASGDTFASLTTAVAGSSIDATFMEWGGAAFGAEVHQSDQGATSGSTLTSGGAITPSAVNAVVVGCGIVGTFGVSSVAPDSGVTEIADFPFPGGNAPANWVGYKALTTAVSTTIGGPITGRSEFGGVTFTLLPTTTSTDNPPDPAQPVPPETVVMNGVNGTTAFPFADGSLRVYVDNVDQTAAIVSYDGLCGTFILAFAPRSTEVVTVTYQGR